MGDSNKNLVIQNLQLVGKLACAMGKPINRECRGVVGPAVKCLTDNKPVVRSVTMVPMLVYKTLPADMMLLNSHGCLHLL